MKTVKVFISTRWILLLGLLFLSISAHGRAVNLVPEEPSTSPNYWCTWYAQNYWVQRGEELSSLEGITNPAARETLTYDTVFNEQEGWAATYLPRGRSDYYFLIDHGWQTKEDSEREYGEAFFSLQIDPRDFPAYANLEPQESLKRFNDDIKALGWRGLGIWMRGTITPDEAERFVKWSKYAGVEYWKIDGGAEVRNFYSFEAKQKFYPELVLEYITGAPPLTPSWKEAGRDSYPSLYEEGGAKQEHALQALQFSDTFRTYDASPVLVTTTTLRRTHDLLKQTQNQQKYRSILNLQDDCTAAAALGCLAVAKRHPNYMERTYQGQDLHHQIRGKRMIQKRMNEVERLGMWQRIAPAFPAGQGSYQASTKELIDSYPYTEHDTWFKDTYGKMVSQSAPAIMARNMPLPEVEIEGEPPYVMATKFPNGPVCVGTEGRVSPTDQWFHPRAKITVQIENTNQPIGVFGHYESLILEFSSPVQNLKELWAQDLLSKRAINIRDRVEIDGNKITIPGRLIDVIGTSAGDNGDISVPGLVLQLNL